MANNVIELVFLFIIVALLIVGGLGAITHSFEANTQGCVTDVNGSLTNCSLTDYGYNRLNGSVQEATTGFSLLGNTNILLGLAIAASALMLLASLIKR